MNKMKITSVRDTGVVTSYNGYEGEIENTNGIKYALLKDNVYGIDRDNITKGSEVEFTPRENTCNTGHIFLTAKNISIINKEQEINPVRARIFKPRKRK